jgi:hypothetical protein
VTWVAEPFSALGWADCVSCGQARALVIEAWADQARCGECLRAEGECVDRASVEIAPPGLDEQREQVRWNEPVSTVVPELIHPTPGHTSRQPLPPGLMLPASVLKLAEHAREAGWAHVQVTYSRGHGVHGSTGKPTAERHVIAVHVGDHMLSARSAVAVYESPVRSESWSWSSMWVWGPDLMFFPVPLLEEMRYFLSAGGQVPERWITDIRARVLKAEADKKALVERDRKIRTGFAEGRTVLELAGMFALTVETVQAITQKKTRTVKEGNS